MSCLTGLLFHNFSFVQLEAQGSSALLETRKKISINGKSALVMRYFWQAYRLVSTELNPRIADSRKKYIITGHSLGGALASIHALMGTQFNKVRLLKCFQRKETIVGPP